MHRTWARLTIGVAAAGLLVLGGCGNGDDAAKDPVPSDSHSIPVPSVPPDWDCTTPDAQGDVSCAQWKGVDRTDDESTGR